MLNHESAKGLTPAPEVAHCWHCFDLNGDWNETEMKLHYGTNVAQQCYLDHNGNWNETDTRLGCSEHLWMWALRRTCTMYNIHNYAG